MLLPSAMPCDLFTIATSRPQRPALPSFNHSSVPAQRFQSNTNSILASCRALQSIIGCAVSLEPQSPAPVVNVPLANPFAPRQSRSPPRFRTPPRGLNKRTRFEFEEDDMKISHGAISGGQDRDQYQTPKRLRRVPSEIPLGLAASDFESLETPKSMQPTEEIEIDMPVLTASPPRTRSSRSLRSKNTNDKSDQVEDGDPDAWSPLDDRRLVEAVLSKLNLSKREWNACAKQLGKDQDSLGRRWRILVNEGNVGLRRGTGRLHERTDLDVKSW